MAGGVGGSLGEETLRRESHCGEARMQAGEAKRLLWGSQGAEKWPLENWSWEVKRQGAVSGGVVSGGRRSAMEKLG